MAFEQGQPTFGISDAKVAAWPAWTGPIDIMGIQMASTTMQVISAIANGDDTVVAAAARLTGAQLQMRFVGMNLPALTVLAGITPGVSGSTSNWMFRGGERMPYFGVIVKALSEEVGDTWVFLPKCKIMSDFTLFQGEYGAFSTPELTVQAVSDTLYGIANFITHPSNVPITAMPPAGISSIP